MSQVGLWNTTLTADEVSSLYNHGLPIDLTTDQAAYESSSNLVGYWRMGSGTLDTYPLIADQTNATLSSELITDGDFPTGTTAFSVGSNWNIANNKASYDNLGSSSLIQNLTFESGKTYQIEFDVLDFTSNYRFDIYTGVSFIQSAIITDKTSFKIYFVGDGGSYIRFRGLTTGSFAIKNLSVKQVNGNPAIMTNQTSSDIENGSPYANIVQNGTFDTDSDWNKGTGWTIANGVASCNNTISAHLSQNALTLGVTYRVSYEIKDYTSGSIRINAGWGGYGTYRSSIGTYTENIVCTGNTFIEATSIGSGFIGSIDNVTVEEPNTGLQGYWKMGDGTNDEYPVIYDQTNPTNGAELVTGFTNGDTYPFTTFTTSGNNITSAIISSAFAGAVTNAISIVTGQVYKVTFDYNKNSGNDLRIVFTNSLSGAGSQASAFELISESGSYTKYFTITSTFSSGYFQMGTGASGHSLNASITNVSIKLVNGNPATMTNMVEGNITNQYPLTKIRNYYRMGDGILDGYPIIQDQTSPNIAHIPTTNVLLYSNDFSNAQWLKLSGSSIGNRVISPDGTLNGWEIIFDGTSSGRIEQARTGMSSGENYSVSVFARVSSGTQTIDFGSVNTATYTLNTEWQRLTRMEAENDTVSYSRIVCNDSATIEIFGFQLEEQSQATAYIKSDGIAAVRKSSTTNLIEYSEDFSEWSTTGTTSVSSNDNISPDGTQNASTVSGLTGSGSNDLYLIVGGNPASKTYSFSVYLKGSGTLRLQMSNNVDQGINETVTLTSDWKRHIVTGTFNSTSGTLSATLDDSGATATQYKIWGAQLEEQTQAEIYAPTKGLPVTIDLFTENNYGTMTNMSASDIIEDTPNN
jgi:hypothetical protein